MDRYKDCDPRVTVERIKGILDGLGVYPEGELLSYADRFFSLRVVDPATGMGTNGKGASPDLAYASAYGEFMERLQNDFLIRPSFANAGSGVHNLSTEDFSYWPEEHRVSFEEALNACPELLHDMDQNYVSGDVVGAESSGGHTQDEMLAFWKSIIGNNVSMVPYYCVGTGELVDLPEDIIRKLDMSNGLASGNTPEEALVEGMSEICERYAKARIMNEELCPPPIPRSFIDENCPVQADMLCAIEERSPELNIVVLDGSLGEGIPTVCMLFINQNAGTIRPKFGSHPSIAIALERCMTEQYQGYSPESSESSGDVFIPWDDWSRKSVHFLPLTQSAFSKDRYAIPDRVIAGRPDWAFEPWGIDSGFTNKQGVDQLTELLRRIGGEVYVRDNSYLGVPAYRIYVPVAASMPTPGGKSVIWTEKYGIAVASALIAYSRGDFSTAASFLRMCQKRRELCAAQELLCRAEGIPEDERDVLLEAYFGAGAAAYAKAVWRSEDAGAALDEFLARDAWLKRLGGGMKREKNPLQDARLELFAKLKARKRANPLNQMDLAPVFERVRRKA